MHASRAGDASCQLQLTPAQGTPMGQLQAQPGRRREAGSLGGRVCAAEGEVSDGITASTAKSRQAEALGKPRPLMGANWKLKSARAGRPEGGAPVPAGTRGRDRSQPANLKWEVRMDSQQAGLGRGCRQLQVGRGCARTGTSDTHPHQASHERLWADNRRD